MYKNKIILLHALASLGVPADGLAATMEETPPPMALRVESSGAIDLSRWPSATFHADMIQSIQDLGTAHGSEKDGVLLNVAELYLSHMLQYEAESTLAGIVPSRPEHMLRHKTITQAAKLLGGHPVPDFAASPLSGTDRDDRAFWATLQAIAASDSAMLQQNFRESFKGLSLQSSAVSRAILPIFAEAAIELNDHKYADAALGLMRETQSFNSSSISHFLTGRAEERRGNESSALQAYFKAAEGWDTFAVRARLAVADMSMRNGGTGALLAAETVLTEGQEAWRGGRLERELLTRLAAVHAALDNKSAQLLTLGKLIGRFPESKSAKKAKMEAALLLAEVYKDGTNGAFSISDWMDLHLQLMQFYRETSSFPKHTETMADYMLSLGATDLAATEYQRAIDLIRQHAAKSAQTKASVNRLRLKLARAQLDGGLTATAKDTLELVDVISGSAQHEKLNQTKAEVLAALNDHTALIETTLSDPSPMHLRHLADALAEQGSWSQARDVLQNFLDKHPQTFSAEDATRLLIAANRVDDTITREKVTSMFPSLSPDPQMIELAKSLDKDGQQLMPLRKEEAMARLEKLEQAFQSINNAKISEE